MANQHSVARRDGVFKTNNVVVEAGWLVASDYELTLNAHQQIGATGLLKGFSARAFRSGVQQPAFRGALG